ncbi:MAG: DUF366 family protein [Deltaproteobacteria bacterium]|nr:DUF366 family protein [Deltaproteobacteria bacterium]
MKKILSQFISKSFPYTGKELSTQYIYRYFDLLGDAIIAFIGPCKVNLSEMVDLEDVKTQSPIYSENMLHFLVEHFGESLEKMVLRQRLLITLCLETFREFGVHSLNRKGDDLYHGDSKLSVSIATVSPLSALIHTGINISSKNTPVQTRGLEDYQINPQAFAERVLKKYVEEMEDVFLASCKVRSVSGS